MYLSDALFPSIFIGLALITSNTLRLLVRHDALEGGCSCCCHSHLGNRGGEFSFGHGGGLPTLQGCKHPFSQFTNFVVPPMYAVFHYRVDCNFPCRGLPYLYFSFFLLLYLKYSGGRKRVLSLLVPLRVSEYVGDFGASLGCFSAKLMGPLGLFFSSCQLRRLLARLSYHSLPHKYTRISFLHCRVL